MKRYRLTEIHEGGFSQARWEVEREVTLPDDAPAPPHSVLLTVLLEDRTPAPEPAGE